MYYISISILKKYYLVSYNDNGRQLQIPNAIKETQLKLYDNNNSVIGYCYLQSLPLTHITSLSRNYHYSKLSKCTVYVAHANIIWILWYCIISQSFLSRYYRIL